MKKLLLILLLFCPLATGAVRQMECKVVGISDGDTLTCLFERKPLKVRLQYIDAPEKSQPFGNKAKQALATLVFKQSVRLQISGYDKYQRLLAVVYLNEKNINLALVEQGMAWAYRQSQPIYENAQHAAQRRKIGLWREENPINPSDWRKKPNVNDLKNAQ